MNNEMNNDLISRQVVIDYLNKLLDGRYDDEKSAMIEGIRTNIRLLPPADKEIAELCGKTNIFE